MFLKFRVFLTIFGLIFFSLNPLAHAKRKFNGFSLKGQPTAYKSNNKVFTAGFSVIGAQGNMGNGLADAPNRKLYYMPVHLFLGFRFGKFRLCGAAEYMQGSQITNATDVANTNTSGSGIAYGPRFDYYDGKQSFGLFYRLSDNYKLAKPDINNTLQQYSATGGYTVQYTHRLIGRLGFVLDYTSEVFTKSLSTANVKWDRTGIGLIFTNFDPK